MMLSLGIFFSGGVRAEKSNLYHPPSWCHQGYVCLTNAEARDTALYIEDLEHEIEDFKIERPKRFGWTLGGGGSLSYTLDDLDSGARFGIGPTIVWGFRF